MGQFMGDELLSGGCFRPILSGAKKHVAPDRESVRIQRPRLFRRRRIGMNSNLAELVAETRLKQAPDVWREGLSATVQSVDLIFRSRAAGGFDCTKRPKRWLPISPGSARRAGDSGRGRAGALSARALKWPRADRAAAGVSLRTGRTLG